MTTVAVFDLDGTITAGDTFLAFLAHVLRRQPHRMLRCLHLPFVAAGFATQLLDNDTVKQYALDAVAGGIGRSEMAVCIDTFAEPCLRRMVKPTALRRIAEHARNGDILVMATASFDIYADTLGQRLGFHHVIATKGLWRAERLAFGFDGPHLLGVHKVTAIQTLLERIGLDRPDVIAYSDHHSDLPLLRYAARGIAVDPTPRLARAVAGLAIPIERWRT